MTGPLATVTQIPVDRHTYRSLAYKYHCPKPAPGSISYVEACVEDQLRLAHEIWGDSDNAWHALSMWNPAFTREAVGPLFDAADEVHDAELYGPAERRYRAVDEYVDALWVLARAVRSAYDVRLAVTR